MKIRRRKIKKSADRIIAIGMITSDTVLSKVYQIWDPAYAETPMLKTVGQWCIDYWRIHNKAPQRAIESIFTDHVEADAIEEGDADLVREFLHDISNEFEREQINANYIIEQAEVAFQLRACVSLADRIKLLAHNSDSAEALGEVARFRAPKLESSKGIEPLSDKEAMRLAFEDQSEPLFHVRGELGKMMNSVLKRDSLIAIMAPEKRGKTWWLCELGLNALSERLNVAFFAVGDMSQNQMILRLSQMVSGKDPNEASYITRPIPDCNSHQQDTCVLSQRVHSHIKLPRNAELKPFKPKELVTLFANKELADGYRPCAKCLRSNKHAQSYRKSIWFEKDFVDKLEWKEAWLEAQRTQQRAKGHRFRLHCTPNGTLNISDLNTVLDTWEEEEDFVADVIVIDYADILAPEDPNEDKRDQINTTWRAMRALSQSRHVFVLTATQADAASYTAANLGMKNFSENKLKHAHVIGTLALNRTDDEKEAGLMRVGWIVLRNSEFHTNKQALVLQSLAEGKPHITSL